MVCCSISTIEVSRLLVRLAKHGIEFCGWDEVSGGWELGCPCGFTTPVLPLMEMVGEAFDDHLRLVGILIDGDDVGKPQEPAVDKKKPKEPKKSGDPKKV